MNISRLWIIYFEGMVGTVGIGFGFERLAKIYQVIHQMKFKFLNVFLLSFSFHKGLPSQEEVVERNDIMVSDV